MIPASSALLTDRYELTMLDAALRGGTAQRDCVFEVFSRSLPGGRRYGVLAGTGRLLELLSRFRFGEDELEFLDAHGIVSPTALAWLADYRFEGSIHGYREGELFFPGSPVLTVEGTFAQAVILETLILSVLNYDSAVASAAARMVSAASGRPLAEMGSRRIGEYSAVAAARAAYIAGFAATSNLEAGRSYGVPTLGTAAHAFTLLHDSEEQAFQAQVDSLGPATTLLVDTYDVTEAVASAVRVAGPALGAVRLDSGDLAAVSRSVRAQLDSLGAPGAGITVTNDLDEYSIAALADAPITSYGVGTSLVTGSGHPTVGFVYKLVAHSDGSGGWRDVAKRSAAKQTVGGRKFAYRTVDESGTLVGESLRFEKAHPVIATGTTSGETAPVQALQVPLVVDGDVSPGLTGAEGVTAARSHHAAVRAALPSDALALEPGEPAISVGYERD